MDRMLFIAMSGAKETLHAQAANNNNLANASTDGFKKDWHQFRSMLMEGPGWDSRAYTLTERPATDLSQGPLRTTGRELDVAAENGAYFSVQTPSGEEGLKSSLSLAILPDGALVDKAGNPALGADGSPIVLPPAKSIAIGVDGSISVVALGDPSNQMAVVNQLKLQKPLVDQPHEALEKGLDGYLRPKADSQDVAWQTEGLRLNSGVLEGSNVSPTESLVDMIQLQRKFDLQVKIMKEAKDQEQSSDRLLRSLG